MRYKWIDGWGRQRRGEIVKESRTWWLFGKPTYVVKCDDGKKRIAIVGQGRAGRRNKPKRQMVHLKPYRVTTE